MTMWEGGGTVPPELAVARRLIARGHQVHVLADPTIAAAAEAAGCTFSPWRRAPHRTSSEPSQELFADWKTRNPLVMLQRVFCPIEVGPAADYAADTAEAIEAVHPDVVVPDAFLFGSVIAGEAMRVPVALLVPNIWIIPIAGTAPAGPGFAPARTALGRTRDAAMLAIATRLSRADLPELNLARSAHGLAPLTSFYDQALGADRILVLTSPVFDYASASVPANVSYVGPVLDDPTWAEPWTPPWPDDNNDPIVLVSFSSTDQKQGPVLRRVVEALTTLPVRGLVTLGQGVGAEPVSSTTNVAVVRSAPHRQVLAEAWLVVCHCGHGITMKTLAAGVPMVCIPMGRDQNDTAARVVYHGAGVRLPATAATTRIRTAVERVVGDGRFRANAARLASAIAEGGGTTDVVAELESLPGR